MIRNQWATPAGWAGPQPGDVGKDVKEGASYHRECPYRPTERSTPVVAEIESTPRLTLGRGASSPRATVDGLILVTASSRATQAAGESDHNVPASMISW